MIDALVDESFDGAQNTQAIRNAIEAASSSAGQGDFVRLPPGNFKIEQILLDKPNVGLIGAGMGATHLTLVDCNYAIVWGGPHLDDSSKAVYYSEISNLHIAGNDTARGGIRLGGISVDPPSYPAVLVNQSSLRNVLITGFTSTIACHTFQPGTANLRGGIGLLFTCAQAITAINLRVELNHHGVVENSAGRVTALSLINVASRRNAKAGFRFTSLKTSGLYSCVAESNGDAGIHIETPEGALDAPVAVDFFNPYLEANSNSSGNSDPETYAVYIKGCDANHSPVFLGFYGGTINVVTESKRGIFATNLSKSLFLKTNVSPSAQNPGVPDIRMGLVDQVFVDMIDENVTVGFDGTVAMRRMVGAKRAIDTYGIPRAQLGRGAGLFKSAGPLHVDGTPNATTDTGQVTLKSYSLPARSMPLNLSSEPGGVTIRIVAWGTTAANGHPKKASISFSGQHIVTNDVTQHPSGKNWHMEAEVTRIGNDAQGSGRGIVGEVQQSFQINTALAPSFDQPIEITVTGETPNAPGELTCNHFRVEVINNSTP